MKNITILCGALLFAHITFSQNQGANSRSEISQSTAVNSNKNLSDFEPGLYLDLGLNSSVDSHQDVLEALKDLKKNNINKYSELHAKYIVSKSENSLISISRADFNVMSDSRKAQIIQHPERYKIID